MATKATKKNSDSSASLGFEAKLWLTAGKLRNNMDRRDDDVRWQLTTELHTQFAESAKLEQQIKHNLASLRPAAGTGATP